MQTVTRFDHKNYAEQAVAKALRFSQLLFQQFPKFEEKVNPNCVLEQFTDHLVFFGFAARTALATITELINAQNMLRKQRILPPDAPQLWMDLTDDQYPAAFEKYCKETIFYLTAMIPSYASIFDRLLAEDQDAREMLPLILGNLVFIFAELRSYYVGFAGLHRRPDGEDSEKTRCLHFGLTLAGNFSNVAELFSKKLLANSLCSLCATAELEHHIKRLDSIRTLAERLFLVSHLHLKVPVASCHDFEHEDLVSDEDTESEDEEEDEEEPEAEEWEEEDSNFIDDGDEPAKESKRARLQ